MWIYVPSDFYLHGNTNMSSELAFIFANIFDDLFVYDEKYNELKFIADVSSETVTEIVTKKPKGIRDIWYRCYPAIMSAHSLYKRYDMNDLLTAIEKDDGYDFIPNSFIMDDMRKNHIFHKIIEQDYLFEKLTEDNDRRHFKLDIPILYEDGLNFDKYAEKGLIDLSQVADHLDRMDIKWTIKYVNDGHSVAPFASRIYASDNASGDIFNRLNDKAKKEYAECVLFNNKNVKRLHLINYCDILEYYRKFDMKDTAISGSITSKIASMWSDNGISGLPEQITASEEEDDELDTMTFEDDSSSEEEEHERKKSRLPSCYVKGSKSYGAKGSKSYGATMYIRGKGGARRSIKGDVSPHPVQKNTSLATNETGILKRIKNTIDYCIDYTLSASYLKLILAIGNMQQKIKICMKNDMDTVVSWLDTDPELAVPYCYEQIKRKVVTRDNLDEYMKKFGIMSDVNRFDLGFAWVESYKEEPPLCIYPNPNYVEDCTKDEKNPINTWRTGRNIKDAWSVAINASTIPQEMNSMKYYDYMVKSNGVKRNPKQTIMYSFFSNSSENKLVFCRSDVELLDPAIPRWYIPVEFKLLKRYLHEDLITTDICMFSQLTKNDWEKISHGKDDIDVVVFCDNKNIYRERTPLKAIIKYIIDNINIEFDAECNEAQVDE